MNDVRDVHEPADLDAARERSRRERDLEWVRRCRDVLRGSKPPKGRSGVRDSGGAEKSVRDAPVASDDVF